MKRICVLLAVVGAALAVPRNPQRIMGGHPTNIQQYPYKTNMQFLYWDVIWGHACGGALITSSAILSAAQCYYRNFPNQWRVRVGSSFASGNGTASTGMFNGTLHNVAQLILHERYNDTTLENDVAIVRLLQRAAVGSSFISVARIAGINYHLYDGTAVTAIGWGALWAGGPFPEQLQRVDVQTISQTICWERYTNLKAQPDHEDIPEVKPGMICSGILDAGGRDTCLGDYGGPLIHDRDIIIGVTSWGYGCGLNHYPGVSTRVSYYSNWIVSNGSG